MDHLLDVGTRPPGSGWRTEEGGPFHFEVVSDPGELDERLRAHATQGSKVRLAASFARPWKTKGSASPWTLPPAQQDFDIEYRRGERVLRWSRPWNHVLDMDYTPFVQATPGSRMAEDPLAEVGCPYVLRGFDFDYVGVLWLSDLVWRGRWVAKLDQVHEVAFRSLRARAKREDGEGPATRELVSRLERGYRILLSRAIRGVFVWFEDEETRRYVEAKLSSALDRE